MMAPMDAAARPFPREDSTPPVMKMYLVVLFVAMISTFLANICRLVNLIYTIKDSLMAP